MWTECSRITQKTSLSGSPKVPSCILLYQEHVQPLANIYVSYNTLICVPAGSVIALELNGDGVVEACRSIANELFNGTKVNIRGSYYFSRLSIEDWLWSSNAFPAVVCFWEQKYVLAWCRQLFQLCWHADGTVKLAQRGTSNECGFIFVWFCPFCHLSELELHMRSHWYLNTVRGL